MNFIDKLFVKRIEKKLIGEFQNNPNSRIRKELEELFIKEFEASVGIGSKQAMEEIYEITDTPGYDNLMSALRNQKWSLAKQSLTSGSDTDVSLKRQGGAIEITKFLRFMKSIKRLANKKTESGEDK